MIINVTQKHIDEARRNQKDSDNYHACSDCVVALAVADAFNIEHRYRISVESSRIILFAESWEMDVEYEFDDRIGANNYISSFDQGFEVEPRSFEIHEA